MEMKKKWWAWIPEKSERYLIRYFHVDFVWFKPELMIFVAHKTCHSWGNRTLLFEQRNLLNCRWSQYLRRWRKQVGGPQKGVNGGPYPKLDISLIFCWTVYQQDVFPIAILKGYSRRGGVSPLFFWETPHWCLNENWIPDHTNFF